MSDIVERLFELWTRVSDVDSITLRDAEDEIKKLRAERDAMQGALLAIKAHTKDANPMSYMADLWRIANAALGEKE
jgi:hypothetical protein